MPASISCQRATFPPSTSGWNVFPSREAQGEEKNHLASNKKPGVKRRAFPSLLRADYAWPLGRKCSKLDLKLPGSLYQSHLWMSGKSGSSERTVLSQASADIRRYYQDSKIRQAYFKLFFGIHLWKTEAMWKSSEPL
jgi:hypothetical protein